MATADIVDVELRARTDSYLRNIKNAETQFVAGLDRIENEAAQAGASLDAVGNKGSQAFQRAASQAPRAAAAISGARLQTANLAAQINDIGVQLAGGTSPFLIAVQQGSQINQVIGQAGAAGAVRALAGAFTSLVNPVSLATFAVIGLGGAAIQYFTEFLSNADKSEEAIKRQNDLIREVAKRWGDAVPALQDYLAELDKAKETADALAAGEFIRSDLFDPLKAGAADLAIEMADFVSVLRDAGADTVLIDDLQASFLALREKIDDSSASTQDTDRAQEALNATMALGFGDATALSDALEVLAGKLRVVAERAAEADRQIAAVTSRSSTGGPARYQPGLIDLPTDVPTPDRRPNDIQRIDDEAAFRDRESRRGAGDRRRAAREAQREAEAVAELIARLDEEIALIGASDEQRAVANNLRRVGASVTEEQRERVAELTRELYRQTEAERAAAEAARELSSIGRDALGGFIQDIRDGVSAADALENALNRVLDRLLDISLDALFDVGGGGGGFLGRLFGGFRASGGPVQSGRAYVVGERGPELFAPGQSGRIIPRIPQVAGTANSSQTISMPIVINAQGADAAGLARVERQLESLKRSIPTRIDARADTRQSRGTRPAT